MLKQVAELFWLELRAKWSVSDNRTSVSLEYET